MWLVQPAKCYIYQTTKRELTKRFGWCSLGLGKGLPCARAWALGPLPQFQHAVCLGWCSLGVGMGLQGLALGPLLHSYRDLQTCGWSSRSSATSIKTQNANND